MKPLAVLAGLAVVTVPLLSVGPPVDTHGRRFSCGPAAGGGAAAREMPLRIMAESVEVVPDAPADFESTGLEPAGAWVLRAENEWFGGLSGLLVEDGRLTAVTDRAHLMRAQFEVSGGELIFSDAALWRLRNDFDHLLGRKLGDGESLARIDGQLLVSFEGRHRIQILDGEGRLQDWAAPEDFFHLPKNGGIEALAGLGDGRVLALAEKLVDGAVLWWLISEDGVVDQGSLVLPSAHRVTGATLGPEGRLWLVFRDFSLFNGISVRIGQMDLEDGRPVSESLTILAEFEESSGIDNMEGISLSDGWLWLVSDDNFNASQRTLLLRFRLPG